MDMKSLEQLEERVTELTDKFLVLKQGHEKVLEELTEKENEIRQLSNKLKKSVQTKVEVQARVEGILKKLETLRVKSKQ